MQLKFDHPNTNKSGKNKKDKVPTPETDAWRALVTNTNKCMIEYDVQEAIAKMRSLDTRFEDYLRILQDQQGNDTGNTYQSYKKALTNRVRSYIQSASKLIGKNASVHWTRTAIVFASVSEA